MIKKWFDLPIAELQNGKNVTIYPKGNSMTPKIESGAKVTLEPIADITSIKRGDIVLSRVGSNVYLHLVTAVDKYRVQISNNHGHVNGWTSKDKVYGRVISVENSSTNTSTEE